MTGAGTQAADVSALGPVAWTAWRVRMPLLVPHRAARGSTAIRDVILVEAAGPDGVVGWGECPTLDDPTYHPETTDSAWSALQGSGPLGIMAQGALVDAALDLSLRRSGRSCSEALGGRRTSIPLRRVVSLASDLDELDGDLPIKLKVTPDSLGALRSARERWPNRSLAADANGSLVVSDLPSWLDGLNLDYLEQPWAPGDWAGAREFRRRFVTPVAVDEAARSPEDLTRLLDGGLADVVSIKPALWGGMWAAAQVIRALADTPVRAFVGGMLETAVGRAAACAVASTLVDDSPCDLGPSQQYFESDLATPVVAQGGRLVVPTGAGIGVEVDRLQLSARAVASAGVPSSVTESVLSNPG